MKFIRAFLMCVCSVTLYANDPIQEIYNQASEIQYNNKSDRDEDELQLEFYTSEIAKLDMQTLEQNPELVFRKAVVWLEVLGSSDSIPDVVAVLPQIQADLQFVLDHAEKQSRLYAAAQLKYDFIDAIVQESRTTAKTVQEICLSFFEGCLKEWAKNPLLQGKALRKDVLSNIQKNPEVAESFYDFFLLLQSDPDLVLGYIQPELVKAMGVERNEEGRHVLLCKVEYTVRNAAQTSEITRSIEFGL